MRITTGMMYDRSLSSLMKSNERLSKATDQANTLEKFTTAGESPTGMAQKLTAGPRSTSPVTRFTEMAPSQVIFWDSFSEAFHSCIYPSPPP